MQLARPLTTRRTRRPRAVASPPPPAVSPARDRNRRANRSEGSTTVRTSISRTYLPGQHVSRAVIDSTGNGLGVFPFRQVGSTAGGTPFFAKPLSDGVRDRYGTPRLPCAMAVYLKVGSDDYIAYGVSGGP